MKIVFGKNVIKFDISEFEEEEEKDLISGKIFIDKLVDYMKKTPNKTWSKQQADFINSILRTSHGTKQDLKAYLDMKKKVEKA